MNRSTPSLLKPNLFLTTLLGSVILASCGAPPSEMAQMPQSSAPVPAAKEASVTKASAPDKPTQGANQAPQSRPQLVKTAEIALVVNSLDDTLREVSQIIQQQQGDLLKLEDDKSPNGNRRQTASLQIRVPQDKLETTLDSLAKLGTVERRNLSAEDVTNQLVDFQARLRNLRKTESTLLQIMNRSGSVGDVLKVAQELSNIRQSIEQIDAQLQSLTNRVAYSTITLQLEAAVSTTSPQQPLGLQVQDTWNNATHSVGELSTDFIRLAIWLVAYSPYLLLLGGATWFGYTRHKKQSS
jgi:archaellum component FlaC